MTTIKVKTITGYVFEVEGSTYKHENGIHYINGESFPDSLVIEVKDEH